MHPFSNIYFTLGEDMFFITPPPYALCRPKNSILLSSLCYICIIYYYLSGLDHNLNHRTSYSSFIRNGLV